MGIASVKPKAKISKIPGQNTHNPGWRLKARVRYCLYIIMTATINIEKHNWLSPNYQRIINYWIKIRRLLTLQTVSVSSIWHKQISTTDRWMITVTTISEHFFVGYWMHIETEAAASQGTVAWWSEGRYIVVRFIPNRLQWYISVHRGGTIHP